MASGPITSWQIDGEKVETTTAFIFLGSKIIADGDCSHEIKRCLPWKESYDKLRQHIKNQRHYFASKCSYRHSYGFSSSQVQTWELDHKEGWVPKNWYFRIMMSNGTPLQYSCLENPMDGGAWWAAVHGVTKGWTWLSDFTFTFHFHALEKEMATHSSVLAWRIPGTGEPGGLPSMGSHRVGHDWSDLAAAVPFLGLP